MGVSEAIVHIAIQQGGLSIDDANTYVDNLIKQNRYLQDVWAVTI